MIEAAIHHLENLCDMIPPLLRKMDTEVFENKPAPGKWSRKEIIGHLIDSASNNHHRFVRGQFENKPAISYNQDKWNEFNYYQQSSKDAIIDLWAAYNRRIVEIIRHMHPENLQRTCMVGEKELTLEFLFNDYVAHLEHHLKQVMDY